MTDWINIRFLNTCFFKDKWLVQIQNCTMLKNGAYTIYHYEEKSIHHNSPLSSQEVYINYTNCQGFAIVVCFLNLR